ncbi:MAG TPA: hypothetical protein ENJ51_12615 [Leucothrix mucor]|uniref:Uncharacterized protein n=1 Tax=Leucothrix mucor TaxID=45248 RepID=A0A7V2T5C3_LEUMU|nr:hypothetical protein [Leucothrix mucor]
MEIIIVLALFIVLAIVILIVNVYKAYQEKRILDAITDLDKKGYLYDNTIHVVDLCRYSATDDVNEAYLFFNNLQKNGKIKSSFQLTGSNSEGSYRRFDEERKGVQHPVMTEVAA